MRLAAGRRDRLITFQRRTGAQESTYGTGVPEWIDLPEDQNPQEWAEVQDVLPSRGENLSEGMNIKRRPARVRIGYREDITSDMRIVLENGRVLSIIAGPVDLGFRDGLEMMCETVTPEGVRP